MLRTPLRSAPLMLAATVLTVLAVVVGVVSQSGPALVPRQRADVQLAGAELVLARPGVTSRSAERGLAGAWTHHAKAERPPPFKLHKAGSR